MASSRRLLMLCMPKRKFSSSATTFNSKSLDYCINLVKRRSYEQYLATLLLPPELRRVGFVVRAFNVEISSVRDQIREKHAGMGRMVFWRELISTIYDENNRSLPNHPVANELNAAISQVRLESKSLQRRAAYSSSIGNCPPPAYQNGRFSTISWQFSAIWGSDGHFEVLKKSVPQLVQKLWHKTQMERLLKYGFCKKSPRKDAPLTSWTLFSSVFFQISADQRCIFPMWLLIKSIF